jgi:uncharacterized membrane protein
MHSIAFVGAILWFALIALLWYVRPGEFVWLAGSLVLSVIFFSGMFWYVTRPK